MQVVQCVQLTEAQANRSTQKICAARACLGLTVKGGHACCCKSEPVYSADYEHYCLPFEVAVLAMESVQVFVVLACAIE